MAIYTDENGDPKPTPIILTIVFVVIGIILFSMFIVPVLKPWWAEKSGEAEFAQAEQNRKIKVLEAQAELDSAKLKAQSEIERAKGVSEANLIVGKSITDSYLKYLYVMGLQTNQMQTIYVPTSGIMPILDLTAK